MSPGPWSAPRPSTATSATAPAVSTSHPSWGDGPFRRGREWVSATCCCVAFLPAIVMGRAVPRAPDGCPLCAEAALAGGTLCGRG
ncbi:hypothetical protein SBRY_11176 [Actinacidiphila bryophytorum]|uniref:Uncharacterized protein n=1 Tax=Actinacidiphila bryophytorum TaxID=1436133 RepID=A0A9W4GXJ4_9ACTN|nr:hypothetical protein SBRY_11176 [Actinacidiphila bryophytorum]